MAPGFGACEKLVLHNNGLQDFVQRMAKVGVPAWAVLNLRACQRRSSRGPTAADCIRLHSGEENLSDHPFAYGGPSCNVKTSCTLFCQCQTPFCFVVDTDIVLTVAPKLSSNIPQNLSAAAAHRCSVPPRTAAAPVLSALSSPSY